MDVVGVALRGKTVSRCYVDSAFGVQFFDAAEEITIRIEGQFLLRLGSEQHTHAPDQRRELGRALDLFGKTVAEATATEGGELRVRFTDETELTVPPSHSYEAWEIAGPEGFLVVSLPGGGLARWGT